MAKSGLKQADLQVEIVSAPIRQQVIKTMFEAITSGKLRPGQRLIEKELCELLGVSRPPVREALRQLESEGLVVTLPKSGPIVAKLSPEDVTNIYQIRGALEALAAKIFAESADDDLIDDLEHAVDKLERAMNSGKVDRVLEAKDQFYAIMLEGADNPIVVNVLRTMNARVRLLRRVSLSSPQRGPQTLEEMRSIVEAIKSRDSDLAFKRSWDHIEKAGKVALASLEDQLKQEAS